MITIMKENAGNLGFTTVDFAEDNVWVRVVDPNFEEQDRLKRDYGIDPDLLSDILDADEQSRLEKEDDGLSAIIRIPVFSPDKEVTYFTVPFGIIIRKSLLITICLYDNPLSQDIFHNRIRHLNLHDANSLLLNCILRASLYYLRFLKEINRKTTVIEKDLERSVKNSELAELLRFQKSLVFFTTSLRSNELLLEKIHKLSAWQLTEDEQETLEDVKIELKQAMEMAKIYSDILSGTVDTFATVISNNLNNVMKRLTVVNLTLMIPTLLASLFGMNVDIPFQHADWAFAGVLGIGLAFSLTAMLIFKSKNLY